MIATATESKEFALVTLADFKTAAAYLAPAFGLSVEQTIMVMLIGEAEKIHPVRALQLYDVIKGKPAPKATTILSRFQADGGVVEWQQWDHKRAAALFSHPVLCPKPVLVELTIEEAEMRGLTTAWDSKTSKHVEKDNWKYHRPAMLRARVASAGVRMIHPGVLNGMLVSEELQDLKEVEATAVDGKPTRLERVKALAEEGEQRIAEKATETKPVEPETKQAPPETKPPAAELQKQQDLAVRQAAANNAETRSRVELPLGGAKQQPLFTAEEQAEIDARKVEKAPPVEQQRIEPGEPVTVKILLERATELQGLIGTPSMIKRLAKLCEDHNCGVGKGNVRRLTLCPAENMRPMLEDLEEDLRLAKADAQKGGAA